MNLLKELNKWFESNCDGDWEHSYGITIETLDNPGWSVYINLYDTYLDDAPFEEISIDNGENDWLSCKVKDYIFIGMGDTKKLETILEIFLQWQKKYDNV